MTDASSPQSDQPGPVEEDAKAKFRAALDAKQAGARRQGTAGRNQGSVNGHAHDAAHGHKVFRRKSG